jgi:hypothetical protein
MQSGVRSRRCFLAELLSQRENILPEMLGKLNVHLHAAAQLNAIFLHSQTDGSMKSSRELTCSQKPTAGCADEDTLASR